VARLVRDVAEAVVVRRAAPLKLRVPYFPVVAVLLNHVARCLDPPHGGIDAPLLRAGDREEFNQVFFIIHIS